ncbi:proteoglycan 4-like isoform X2 [Mercenaria mercenaria]|nr:proteoglycan 4-like isoform X2 [Mercenaria mercenaria]XP_053388119.1 proteoglycan 4-like isoform X2 [Mercenaria mercenaria]XP_053388120.1 proteoglycan 4-like isoform X2 [Mercenaria mercenaria]
MHQLLKEVLFEPCEQSVKMLLEYENKKDKDGPKPKMPTKNLKKGETSQRKKAPTKKESSPPKKPDSNPRKMVIGQNVEELPGTSLMETWRLINEKDKEFTPSTELVSVLKKLSTPSIQAEIKEMIRYFESKEEKEYTEIGNEASSYARTAKNYLDLPYTSNSQNSSIMPTHFTQQPYLYEHSNFSTTHTSQHTASTSLNQSMEEYTASPLQYTQDYCSQNILQSPGQQHQSFNLSPNNNPTNVSQNSGQSHFSQTPNTSPYTPQSIFNTPSNTAQNHAHQLDFNHAQTTTPNITPNSTQTPQPTTPNITQTPQPTTPNITQTPQPTTPNITQTPQPTTPNITQTPQTSSPNTIQTPQTTQSTGDVQEVRRSPRKRLIMPQEPLVSTPDENITLMGNVKIPRKVLRAARNLALKNERPAFTLMSKLLTGVFSTSELANSRGLGLAPIKADDTRPALDAERIKACKEYVIAWSLDVQKRTPQDKDLNMAVTEQTAYARKKMKRSLAQKN